MILFVKESQRQQNNILTDSLNFQRLEHDEVEVEVEMADQVSAELEILKTRLASLEASERSARNDLEESRKKLTSMSERAVTAEARANEIERRADNLNTELARLNARNADLVKTLAETVKRAKVTRWNTSEKQ